MPNLPTDFAFTAWKRQADVALEIAEAIVEAAEKAREIQLAAAVDAQMRIASVLAGGAQGALPPDFLAGMPALPSFVQAALKPLEKAA